MADVEWELPNGNSIIPNIFCTTATPHLGKRGGTYINLPRYVETSVGMVLRGTGRDLFGLNKVMENLVTEAKYREPLVRFSKRVAYANAFGTDLQVPTATAAFLADSESPHYTQEHRDPFLLTVETPRNEEILASIEKDKVSSATTHLPTTTVARILDAMGWTKVFCDVRDKLVSVPVPFQEKSSSEFEKQETWTSHELKSTIASSIVFDKKWPIPFGHTMLIANSKSEIYAKLNQGGLPFVKQMASDFLDDVLKCKVMQE